jgi:hypothetical protein
VKNRLTQTDPRLIVLPVSSTKQAVEDPSPNWLAKLVASAGFFFAGGIIALAGSLAGMFSAIVGIALLTWGFTAFMASLLVWTHGGHATAGRVLMAFAIASAAVSGLLGFTESGEIAFGASALFVFAALGSALEVRSGDIRGR